MLVRRFVTRSRLDATYDGLVAGRFRTGPWPAHSSGELASRGEPTGTADDATPFDLGMMKIQAHCKMFHRWFFLLQFPLRSPRRHLASQILADRSSNT